LKKKWEQKTSGLPKKKKYFFVPKEERI